MDEKVNNEQRIKLIKENKFFKHQFTNKIGQELIKYLTQMSYYDLINPQPVDLNKNTLRKIFDYLKVIDEYVDKPLNEYKTEDISKFLNNLKESDKKKVNVLDRYCGEFKRFWRVYREYELHNNKKFEAKNFEWGLKVKAPKVKRIYEDYPYLNVQDINILAENMPNIESKVRVLVSINLLGRKCEIAQLKYSDLEFRDQSVYIKLPDIKLMSSNKVPVELYTFVRAELIKYIEIMKFKHGDILFPTKEITFAKQLSKVSNDLFNKQITPKTLRKIGVCIAEDLGYTRADVERIGGWSVNSDVLNHYFKRKGVDSKEQSKRADNLLNKDFNVELEKVKAENKNIREMLDEAIANMKEAEKMSEDALKTNRELLLMVKDIFNPKIEIKKRVK